MLTRAQKKKKEEFNRKLKLISKVFGGVLFAVLGLIYLYSSGNEDLTGSQGDTYGSSEVKSKTAMVTPEAVTGTSVPDKIDDSGNKEEVTGKEAQNVDDDGHAGRIDINSADVKELTRLNGIGEKRAKDIIEYREKNGPFKSIEDIMKVKGIKEGIFNKIRDYIYCGGNDGS
ncbi:MAG: helix-hairpin-helix domain-containing protein [Lachnospiraceae bacterium]|nr:helix-hairpin-helix domain-containing protein [Lachnospiraceae bacterium]